MTSLAANLLITVLLCGSLLWKVGTSRRIPRTTYNGPEYARTGFARRSHDDRHLVTELTHFDKDGASRMVDVGEKLPTQRAAVASSVVHAKRETIDRIRNRDLAKGDVLEVARLAGIMAAKRTSDLIPLCHPLAISSAKVDFDFPDSQRVRIRAEVKVSGQTGVEMEALTAASVTALTIYDMCKAIDRAMIIESTQLEEKHGGKSGHFRRQPDPPKAPVS